MTLDTGLPRGGVAKQMTFQRLIHILKQISIRRHFKKMIWLILFLLIVCIGSLGLFWIEYTGHAESWELKPGLQLFTRLPKLLNIYYLPKMIGKNNLPQYEINFNNQDFAEIKNNIPHEHCCGCLPDKADEYFPAEFKFASQTYQVKIKIRGECWTHWMYPKKSWRIKFDDENLFNGQKQINLIIPSDREYIAEYLNTYRASKLNLIMPEMNYVTLKINDNYYGLYIQEERLTGQTLEKNNQRADVNIYGDEIISSNLFIDLFAWQKYNADQISTIDNFGELKLLLDLINQPDDEKFFKQIENLIDLDNFTNWTVLSTLADSYRQDYAHNMRLYFDSTIGKFKFIPNDVGLSVTDNIDVIYNPLVTRMMKNPQFILKRNQILWDYIKNDDQLENDLNFFDQTYNQIKLAIYRD